MNNYPHIIVTSAPRSGSTALAKLLGQQEKLFVTNELGIYDDWDNLNKWQNFIHTKKWINFVANENIFKAHSLDLYKFREQVIQEKMSGQDVFNWVCNILPEGTLIGDKCPITYLHNMPIFWNKFPNSKFIIVVRDGRDVIASQIRGYQKWPPGSPDHAEHWMKPTIEEAQSLWLNISKLTLNIIERFRSARIFWFKYEEAVKNPEKFCKDISDFLGVGVINFDDYFRATNIGKWESEYPSMMNKLSDSFKELLVKFNYI